MPRTWLQAATRSFNSAVNWPRQQRRLFYTTMAGQLEAGVATSTAVRNLARSGGFQKATSKVMGQMSAELAQGRTFWQALDATQAVPADEIGVVRVAEQSAVLSEGLRDLAREATSKLGIARSVLAPNAYYLVALVAALFGLAQLAELMEAGALVPEVLEDNDAYRLSRLVSGYGPGIGGAAGGLVLAVMVARARWTGWQRVLLLVFDWEYRARVTIQFAEHAARLYARGGTHTDVLDAYKSAYGHSGYRQWAVTEARREHVDGGVSIETAIKGRLVSAGVASLVASMVPGGDRNRYAGAWASIAESRRELLRAAFARVSNMVKLGTVAVLGGAMSVVVPGMYAAYTTV